MTMIKAIDTLYRGNYFRSRLEARWAVFFDAVGIKYEYEPNGFSHSGECYLPDFYLPETYLKNSKSKGIYIEIKPAIYENDSIPQSAWFNKKLVLFKGLPIDNIWSSPSAKGGIVLYPYEDYSMMIWVCADCGTSKIEYWATGNNYCPNCEFKCAEDLLLEMANHATKTRFEHNK